MIEAVSTATEQQKKTEPRWSMTVRRCALVLSKLVPKGEPETMDLREALDRFVAGGTQSGKMNILKARSGCFVGIIQVENEKRNFLLVNPDMTNDIGWLLRKSPEFETMIKEVYRVDDVIIPRNAVDLPPQGFSQGVG